jgi:hypothetical protein
MKFQLLERRLPLDSYIDICGYWQGVTTGSPKQKKIQHFTWHFMSLPSPTKQAVYTSSAASVGHSHCLFDENNEDQRLNTSFGSSRVAPLSANGPECSRDFSTILCIANKSYSLSTTSHIYNYSVNSGFGVSFFGRSLRGWL